MKNKLTKRSIHPLILIEELEEFSRHLDQPELKTVLKSAFRMAAPLYRERMLWVFVRDACGVDSTTARDICHAYGWHPDQIGTMIENKK